MIYANFPRALDTGPKSSLKSIATGSGVTKGHPFNVHVYLLRSGSKLYIFMYTVINCTFSIKPFDPFGTEKKTKKFTDLQITYRVYRR